MDGGPDDGGASSPDVGTPDAGSVPDSGTSDMGVAPVTCNPAGQPFGGGQGTEDSPHLLCSPSHLDRIRDAGNEGWVYRMASDIDLAQLPTPFVPLPLLTGVLDGDDYAIYNFVIDDPDGQELALVSQLEGTIRDLNLPDVRINANQLVSALAFRLVDDTDARVENVFVSGDIVVSAGRAAGIVGSVGNGAVVDGAYFAGSVTNTGGGTGFIGGIAVNVADGGRMRRVVSQAYINSNASKAGGIVSDVSGEISECISSAIVQGTSSQLGGVAAVLARSGVIRDCLVVSQIVGNTTAAGGVYGAVFQIAEPVISRVVSVTGFAQTAGDPIGPSNLDAMVYDSVVFDREVSGETSVVPSAAGLTTAELVAGTGTGTMAAFARPEWLLPQGSYPTPSFFASFGPRRVPCLSTGTPFGGGDGSPTRPFVVCTAAHLDQVRIAPAASFILGRDVDLAGFGFEPIAPAFTGVFDGLGFAIRNWTFGGTSASGVAFFTEVSGRVRNLALLDVDLRADSQLAGLVLGTTNAAPALIENVRVTGSLSVANGNLGGVVGVLRAGGWLEGASFEGTLTSSAGQFHGGVVRNVQPGALARKLDARGEMNLLGSAQKAGGIASDVNGAMVGAVSNMRMTSQSGIRVAGIAAVLGAGSVVTDVRVAGSIELAQGPTLVGGLFGEPFQGGGRLVERALFHGTFSAPSGDFPPAFGRHTADIFLSEVYYDQDLVPGSTSSVMGVQALTTTQMQDPATFSAWPSPPWLFTAGQYPRLDFEAP